MQFSATQLSAEMIMCLLHLMVICNMGRSRTCQNIITCKFCLFDLIIDVPSTIFQLNRDESSWVEPVLS